MAGYPATLLLLMYHYFWYTCIVYLLYICYATHLLPTLTFYRWYSPTTTTTTTTTTTKLFVDFKFVKQPFTFYFCITNTLRWIWITIDKGIGSPCRNLTRVIDSAFFVILLVVTIVVGIRIVWKQKCFSRRTLFIVKDLIRYCVFKNSKFEQMYN